MNSENQYNIKEKLAALDSLPGEAYDKENAWEKLHQRLQKKPTRKKTLWYWTAAGLLPVIAIFFFINHKKEIVLVKNKPGKQQQAPIPATQLKTAPKETIVAATLSSEKNQTIKSNPAGLHNKIQNKNTKVKNKELLIASDNIIVEKTPEAITNIVPPADTATTIVTALVVKKKSRVVHINELETAPVVNPEQIALSNHHEQPKIKFRLRNNHSFNTASADQQPQQEYTGGIKIHLNN